MHFTLNVVEMEIITRSEIFSPTLKIFPSRSIDIQIEKVITYILGTTDLQTYGI